MSSASLIAKAFAGVAITGGAVATPFVLLNGSNNSEKATSEQLEVLDRGKFHLGRKFEGCFKLLEGSLRKVNNQEIYACPLTDNKLEMIYFEEESAQNKTSRKIKELEQNFKTSSQHELIIKFEDSSTKKLDWPTGLLFDYTDPSSIREKAGKSTLNPENECKFTEPSERILFECNDVWKVIKPRK